MAKRPLGLGKQNREKKRKVENGEKKNDEASRESTPLRSQMSVELDDDADLDDELAQLKGLWSKYFHSDRDDEYVLNGIVHECDRLLRLSEEKEEIKKTLNDVFHGIYALALSELTIFKAGDEEVTEEKRREDVSSFFKCAIERVESGLSRFPDSQFLKLVLAKIIFQRIPLEHISILDSKSKDEKLDLVEQFECGKKHFSIYESDTELTYEVLQMMNDLLDIVENFGREQSMQEGIDSDNEEDDELVDIKLEPEHPVFPLQQSLEDNYEWLREHFGKLLDGMDTDSEMYPSVANTIGELYLKKAEKPGRIFLSVQYNDDSAEKASDKEAMEAQKSALKHTKKALQYLEKAKSEDDPDTWVQVAEAYIDLGNLLDNESAEQEGAYKTAEEILSKANKASHGKFQDILDNFSRN
ncbi:hypothetical protein SKDZ_15G2020 [Saccharomyces kudriavzevii ZP591]|uniref:Enhancer of translation termination 1 n=1 Tax=Saccharomyces cerevisiae x Saccharomyces kudriavzevii (strain VIN7) TaxID=1095631 RepID=H0H121_SACCK|nr:YOR051C-like protein [Saccharomyces cerevisiae x Saccharomyces kudriavzevii VIN7]CAI4051363.1 hypothetical protein SKDZ_15G2020 [Saccharomyces kudriavzevii ZP591]